MKREYILTLFVLFAITLRVVPHPPNFAPITALALFSGATFRNKYIGMIIPLIAMVISDIFLGFYTISYWVYGAFILINLLGQYKKKVTAFTLVVSSILFFIVSNFGVWILGYPKTVEGFVTCYILAIPFLGYALVGDLFFGLVFKNSFDFIEKKWLTTTYSKI